MKYRLAVFDLDGTILNTLDDLAGSINYALKCSDMPERTIDEVRSFVGNGIRKLVERAVPKGTDSAIIDEVHNSFTVHYTDHCADKTKPYDGIEQLLANLRRAGCLTAVVSNKADYAVQGLCKQYFDGMFDYAVGEREGIRKKPAPDSVNEVLHRLGVPKNEAVYIGDSDVDVETAKNAGMDCISVEWGFRNRDFLEKHGAKLIVGSADEAEKIILSE
ncbi:MAG: HAD-IA family hydrolase [Oscillospiraceae bacterium]|nr:HAD-IA family hydrolase [Oscillospiraceae bacterium]